jgi:hypothetical protein
MAAELRRDMGEGSEAGMPPPCPALRNDALLSFDHHDDSVVITITITITTTIGSPSGSPFATRVADTRPTRNQSH